MPLRDLAAILNGQGALDDLLTEFLTETFENLSVLDVELMKLEQSPNDINLLGNIFRLVHTVKGTCGFLRLPRLETVAHAGENVLGRLRDGELVANTAAVSLILECLDRIRMIMADLERTGSEPEGDDQDLIRRLNSMAESASAPAGFGIEPAPSASSIAATSLAKPADSRSIYEQIGGMGTIDAAVEVMFNRALGDLRVGRLFAGHDNDHLQGRFRDYLAKICGEPDGFGTLDPANSRSHFLPRGVSESNFDALAGHLHAALGALEVPANLSSMIMGMIYSSRGEILEASATRDREASHRASAPAKEPAPRSPARTCEAAAQAKVDVLDPREISVTAQSIRVNVDLIENLMAMVSELVLTRNQVLQILRKQKDSEFAGPLQRLNRVTTELQEGVMKTRMQPIGNAWSKLPRLVRDLSHELKKKIDLEMIGQHTELDRQVLEMIRDPLTHMVRNSADHGMETPGERLRAGKPEVGKITLNAYHEGGQIVIEIADDGRGLPLEKIKAKILQSGLAGERDLETMPERQIQQYIFKAGFSTAAKVTGVSGRGVGMDVVRSNIEKIGGTVELHYREGKGTRFVVKIPLTLAIVSALIVECAGERLAIPQISVVELVRSASNAELQVERIKGTPVLRLRNRLLPLVSCGICCA
jgi:two-component system chemotaxis sensor kinase CheA